MVKTWFVWFTICAYSIHISYVLGIEDITFKNGQVDISKAFTTCSRGWFTFGEMCYKLGGKKNVGKLTWDEAQEACKEEYNGNLATVYSQKIQDFLNTFLLLNAQSNVWIGLHDKDNESAYKWADGTKYNYSNFEPLEPSGFARQEEDCIEMTFKSTRPLGKPGQWNDLRCSRENQFICQKPKDKQNSVSVLDPRYCTTKQGIGWRFEKSCFYVVTESKNWSEAENFCAEEYNGHLATIDYRVNEYLKYVLQKVTEQMWIGIKIKEVPQQKWSSGWLVSFENWPQQDEYVDGTCVLRDRNGTWLIKSCKKKLWFLCEYSTATPPALKPPVENVHCPEEPAGWRDLDLDLCYYIDLRADVSIGMKPISIA
ncbi:Macrophage mannose receptor 1 like protein [Argiope bruennichi]|uniref:Macrophage mannose receptor 1 like protein n=1 Tax=Argiope bruennichi TaxID=94029 RepID=A0A8T0FY94_ARGBR|nr:Macrophage mannose receptor 1 like protein [Argiope bruennichi]